MGDNGEGGDLNLKKWVTSFMEGSQTEPFLFFFFTFLKYGKDYLCFETDSTRSCGDYQKIIFCPATFGSGFKSKKKPIVDPVGVIRTYIFFFCRNKF